MNAPYRFAADHTGLVVVYRLPRGLWIRIFVAAVSA